MKGGIKMMMKIYKNYYTIGYTERFAFGEDRLNAIYSDEIMVELPEGVKEIELISGGKAIELSNGEICDQVLTQRYHNGNAIPYVVDCSGNYPKNVYLKVVEQ